MRQVLDNNLILQSIHNRLMFIPVDEGVNPVLQWRIRPVAEVGDQIVDIGIGVRHIAGLHGQKIFLRFFAESILQGCYKIQQRHWLIVTDVINPVRRFTAAGIRIIAGPIRVGLRRLIDDFRHPGDDVVDIGKIAPVIAVIEHVNRLSLDDVAGKEDRRHVRPSPRPIDGEKAEPGGREMI